jgi:hypothetical protein
MPARNPEAVRQRAIAAARQRTGQPATPSLEPVFVALNPGALPARKRSEAELYQWVRREEQYATLGANVVVELNSESHARQPTIRAWAIIRRAQRPTTGPATAKHAASVATPTAPPAPADPIRPTIRGWLRMPDDLGSLKEHKSFNPSTLRAKLIPQRRRGEVMAGLSVGGTRRPCPPVSGVLSYRRSSTWRRPATFTGMPIFTL